MSNIRKTFKSFINEELNQETYYSAADKLEVAGHPKRGEELRKHARSKHDTNTVTINDVEYQMNETDIHIDKNNSLLLTLTNIADINNTTKNKDQRQLTVNFNAKEVEVLGIDGVTDRRDGKKLHDFVKKLINKNVDKYPQLEDLLSKMTVNNFYR